MLLQPLAQGDDAAESIAEFTELARSAGAQVAEVITARLNAPNPRYLVGSGKIEELRAARELHGADLIIVNHHLSPAQERNIEQACQCRVVDRSGLILDIFAQRARSHEGKLQVELAQLKHMATRLVRGWTHLERQRGGGVGLRGPGETQLETDRRLLAERVKSLEKRLAQVEVRQTQAKRARTRSRTPLVALVGYTNAGKSTLFNALTESDVYVADQLFATLDPTVRRFTGLKSSPIVLADTVGFVRNLPHDLIAAFRSTLSEARDADLLLHVVDAHDPQREARIAQVDAVLTEIGADGIPQILVFNKADLLNEIPSEIPVSATTPKVWLSAMQRTGITALKDAIDAHFADKRLARRLFVPLHAAKVRAQIYQWGTITHEELQDAGWLMDVELPWQQAQAIQDLLQGFASES